MRVEEERLLSRVAALENQLLQAGKNWTNERLREEFTKLEARNHKLSLVLILYTKLTLLFIITIITIVLFINRKTN